MSAVWYRFRASFRRRARTYVGISLLLGLMGGVAMAAVAGARRTVSAFPRFRQSTNPSDMQVDVGPYDPSGIEAIRRLSQVVRTATYVAFYAAPLLPDGFRQIPERPLLAITPLIQTENARGEGVQLCRPCPRRRFARDV